MKILFLTFLLTFSIFAQETQQTETVTLPDSQNSWIINIHQRGGILGIHKLLVTINSNGKYACGENGKVKSLASTDSNFLELVEIIKPLQEDIILQRINEDLASCSDCLFNTFSLRRKHEKVADGEIVFASFRKNAGATLKEISQKVWKAVSCE